MSTYLTMRTRIQNELVRTDIDARINEAIVTAIQHWERERFFFNEARTTLVTVADQENYSTSDGVPTGLVGIDTLKITVNGNLYPLTLRSYAEIENKKTNLSFTGWPYEYAYYQEDLWPYPIPNASLTLVMSYIARLPEISLSATNAATNAWMVDAEALIRSRAKAIIKIDVGENESSKTEAMMMLQKGSASLSLMEESIKVKLQAEVTRRVQTGRIAPTQF